MPGLGTALHREEVRHARRRCAHTRRSGRPFRLSRLSLLPAATSVRHASNQPGTVSTRLHRRGGRVARSTRVRSAGRRASGAFRPHAADHVREFSAVRRNIQDPARRASPPRRGQSHQADRDRRADPAGRRAGDRLRRTGHDAGPDRRALAYDLRRTPGTYPAFGRHRLYLSCRERRGRADADAGLHNRPGPRRPVLCLETGDRRRAATGTCVPSPICRGALAAR